jgi:hypothetical protein
MLREDPLGGRIGDFPYRNSTLAYHVEGSGSPVLITHGQSGESDSYDWRYIFDCLAGAFLVYGLDVTGSSDRLERWRAHYSGLIESFIRKVIGRKTSIIASPVETPFVLLAAFHASRHVDKVMLAFPEGAILIPHPRHHRAGHAGATAGHPVHRGDQRRGVLAARGMRRFTSPVCDRPHRGHERLQRLVPPLRGPARRDRPVEVLRLRHTVPGLMPGQTPVTFEERYI